jgi:arylsulfatase A-like enzyme
MTMRLDFFKLASIGVLAGIVVSGFANSEKPNILFIFTDDQSHRTVSCYDESRSWVKTPNIDRLASQGIRFRHAFGGSWCAPSRAMTLTGRLPHAIEGLDFSKYPEINRDPELFRMWPEVLRGEGYTTALVGKWHLGEDIAHGKAWDHSIVWNHSNPGMAGEYFRDQKLRFDGGNYVPVDGHSTDNYTRYALDFIEREHEQPWMLWLCYDAVHAPFTPSDRNSEEYANVGPIPVPEDIYPPRPTKSRYMRDYSMFEPNADGVPVDERQLLELPELVKKYNRGVLDLDEGVGDLVASLERTGQLENTIIIYTADQGIAMGHHGMEIKVAPYDDNIRVPMIVRLPGKASSGRVVEQPVNVIDLIPTLFDYTGIDLPWTMSGDNLRALIENRNERWDRPILQENFSMFFGPSTDVGVTQPNPNQNVDWWIFLRHGEFKYITTLIPDEIEELYHIPNDPRELNNLALDSGYRKTLEEMRSMMKRELKRTRAALVDNLPEPRRM